MELQIWDLFRGYEYAHGEFSVRGGANEGKAKGKALTIKSPASQALWDAHLAGTGPGVGVIPLLENDNVVWSCIDIDKYPLDHAELETQITELGLPLVICRSKSGGAHCFLFTKEEVPAKLAQSKLESWAAALGYGGSEVFPKQTSRVNDQDVGNWLNMPYYYVDMTTRYGIKDGAQLDLNDFLEYAESKRVTLAELHDMQIAVPKGNKRAEGAKEVIENTGLFEDGPPCLQLLKSRGGFPDGTRNEGMYSVAVYLRKRFPDDWQDKVQQYNLEMCSPALSLSEVNSLVKSVGRKDYEYKCKVPPLEPHCHRKLCQARKCGVGETAEGGNRPQIDHVVKHMGNPVIWFVDLGGNRIMLTTEELLSQTKFKLRVMETLNRVPPTLPQARWERYIDALVSECDVVEVPEEASPEGQFRLLVEQFMTGQAKATSKEELATRLTPFHTGEGEVWFRSRGLLDYLSNHGFKIRSEHHTWQMLRDLGAETKSIRAGESVVSVWVMPSPRNVGPEEELPEFGQEEF